MGKSQSNLASHLQTIANEIGGDIRIIGAKAGRKPVTAYRTKAELILAQSAPVAALVQARMLRGDIPLNDAIFRCCDLVLDRICGKARQQVDLFTDSGVDGLIELAKRLDTFRTPKVLLEPREQIEAGVSHNCTFTT